MTALRELHGVAREFIEHLPEPVRVAADADRHVVGDPHATPSPCSLRRMKRWKRAPRSRPRSANPSSVMRPASILKSSTSSMSARRIRPACPVQRADQLALVRGQRRRSRLVRRCPAPRSSAGGSCSPPCCREVARLRGRCGKGLVEGAARRVERSCPAGASALRRSRSISARNPISGRTRPITTICTRYGCGHEDRRGRVSGGLRDRTLKDRRYADQERAAVRTSAART